MKKYVLASLLFCIFLPLASSACELEGNWFVFEEVRLINILKTLADAGGYEITIVNVDERSIVNAEFEDMSAIQAIQGLAREMGFDIIVNGQSITVTGVDVKQGA